MPEYRRTHTGLSPAPIVPSATAAPSGAALDLRESSPPEGTPSVSRTARSSSQSQVIPKADPGAHVDRHPSVDAGEADALEGAPTLRDSSLEAGNVALAPLVSSLAHDLNNLLQIISTTTQLLRLREQNNDGQLFLGDIANATDRAARLTCQLLDAARAQRQRQSDGEG